MCLLSYLQNILGQYVFTVASLLTVKRSKDLPQCHFSILRFLHEIFIVVQMQDTNFPVILLLIIETETGGVIFGTMSPVDRFLCVLLACLLLLL